MSQNDMNMANAPGSTFRADVNSALQALASNNGAATAPSTTYANQWWFDTANDQLKIRDEANTAWVIVASLVAAVWIPYRNGVALGPIATLDYASINQNLVMTGKDIQEAKATVASASNVNLSTAGANAIDITGTATIAGWTTGQAGTYYRCRYTGAGLTLTQNATSNILPTAADIAVETNDTFGVYCLGSNNVAIVAYQRASGASLSGVAVPAAVVLTVANNATTPNSKIDVSAAHCTMVNATGGAKYKSGAAVTIDLTASGANGLDTGAVASSTWYNLFLISNGVTTAGLASLSATAPTMPSGYTFKMRVGAVRTDGSSNLKRTLQSGKRATYTVVAATNTPNLPAMQAGVTGNVTTPTWTAVTLSGFVPPTATRLQVCTSVGPANGVGMAAPNNSYGGYNSTTNPPPLSGIGDASNSKACHGEMPIESASCYFASNHANISLFCVGWEDAINA